MAEARPTRPEVLFDLAKNIHADEIVVPDTLKDWEATVGQARAFRVHLTPQRESDFAFMGVAQGETEAEVMKCVAAFFKLGYFMTIGIPRVLNYTIGHGARARIWARIIETYGDEFDTHFLGYSDDMFEIEELTKLDIEGIKPRSIDTSLPFSLAMEGLEFQEGTYVDRPPAYFDRVLTRAQQRLARRNCDYFIAKASGGEV